MSTSELTQTEVETIKKGYNCDDCCNLNKHFEKKTAWHEVRDDDYKFYTIIGVGCVTLYLFLRLQERQPRPQIISS